MKFKNLKLKFLAYAFLGSIAAMSTIYFSYDEYQDNKRKMAYQKILMEISDLSHFDEKEKFHDKIDTLRRYIVDVTAYEINDEFYRTWRDDNAMAQNILDYAHGKRPDQPPFECATRRGLMSGILKLAGFRTRAIDLYDSDDNLASHSFLEVFNPETKMWETQDPAYDIHWENKNTGKRASVVTGLSQLKDYHPCGRGGCGWNIVSVEQTGAKRLKDLIKIVSVIDKQGGQRFSIYKQGVDPEALYTLNKETGRFCDLIAKNCKDGFSVAPGRVN